MTEWHALESISQLRFPTRVPVRTVWPSEPQHFTPWLADNLSMLEILELGPLIIEGIEHQVEGTGRWLDILALTSSGTRVAIENQFSTADHDHLTRGLAYAVGVDARFLVVIAESHMSEFRRVAHYLNEVAGTESDASRRIGVFLVDLAVEQVENYFVPRMEVVVRPEWATADSAAKPGKLTSVEQFLAACVPDRQEIQRQIIDEFLQRAGASESHDAVACVALYLTNPATGRRANIAQLYTDGSFVVCRGYVLDSAVFAEEADRAHFDEQLRVIFGDYRQTPKNYYPNMGHVTVEQAAQYASLVEIQYQVWAARPR